MPTALELSAIRGDFKMFKYLLENGASLFKIQDKTKKAMSTEYNNQNCNMLDFVVGIKKYNRRMYILNKYAQYNEIINYLQKNVQKYKI